MPGRAFRWLIDSFRSSQQPTRNWNFKMIFLNFLNGSFWNFKPLVIDFLPSFLPGEFSLGFLPQIFPMVPGVMLMLSWSLCLSLVCLLMPGVSSLALSGAWCFFPASPVLFCPLGLGVALSLGFHWPFDLVEQTNTVVWPNGGGVPLCNGYALSFPDNKIVWPL